MIIGLIFNPITGWILSLIKLFNDCKSSLIISSPLLRYNSSRPTFLKKDWSTGGMIYILMQPDESPDSCVAIKHLAAIGECLFDLSLDGPRLRPELFGSRSNMSHERNYHSFVGKVACGRWSIATCRKYFWGILFYWICDCSAIKEVLEYDGSIHRLKRWAQELLAYNFFVFIVRIKWWRMLIIYVVTSTLSSIDILSTHLLPKISCHDPLLTTSIFFHVVLTHVMFHKLIFPWYQHCIHYSHSFGALSLPNLVLFQSVIFTHHITSSIIIVYSSSTNWFRLVIFWLRC